MPSKTVVILGGGVGGMIAANRLSERLTPDHRVVLVERDAQHAFAPSFLWLMTGDRKPHQVRRPVVDLLRRGVECIHGNAEALDLTKRKVFTSAGEIPFDYLIVAVRTGLEAGNLWSHVEDGRQAVRHPYHRLIKRILEGITRAILDHSERPTLRFGT